MELEEQLRDFDRRVEESRGEIQAHLESIERCCKEAEEARRRDWEELEGRMMTAEEKRQHESDGIQRLMATMTDAHLTVIHSAAADIRREFAEGRAENRAQTEAIWRLLDRLPPPEPER